MALKIIDAGLGEDERRALKLSKMAVAGAHPVRCPWCNRASGIPPSINFETL